MKPRLILALMALLLAACAPAQHSAADIQNTAAVIAQTNVALTQTTLPSVSTSSTTVVTPPPATLTLTPEVTPLAPTLTPPPPTLPPMITPDAYQVKHWQEYQTELAKVVLSIRPELESDPGIYKAAFCEWDILGESGQEVYVYVVCVVATGITDARSPAIIYLEPNGAIQKVKLPEPKANSSMFDYSPFPTDVQEKFCYYFDPFPSDLPPCPFGAMYPRPRLNALYAHIEYRKTHLDEPPLAVLLATPTP